MSEFRCFGLVHGQKYHPFRSSVATSLYKASSNKGRVGLRLENPWAVVHARYIKRVHALSLFDTESMPKPNYKLKSVSYISHPDTQLQRAQLREDASFGYIPQLPGDTAEVG